MTELPHFPLSPLHLEFMLAFFASGDPEGRLGHLLHTEVGKTIKDWMIFEDLIVRERDGSCVSTERLGVYIQHLLTRPLPVKTWTIPAEGDK